MTSPILGAVLGLMLGLGLVLFLRSLTAPLPRVRSHRRLSRWIVDADVVRISPSALVWASVATGIAAGFVTLMATALPVVALLAGLAGVCLPYALVRRRIEQRRRQIAAAWPDAIDSLVSGVRAGYSLSQALCELGVSGPLPLRMCFVDLDRDVRVAGSLDAALEQLQQRLADPVADRVIAALRLAHHVGGTDLGHVLRSLSQMLREDARTRGEITARQSWTVNAARMAVAAPWLTLAFLCLRSEAVSAYASFEGAAILLACAGLTVIAYLLMLRIGRMPTEPRLAP